jgi:hypothetical protein
VNVIKIEIEAIRKDKRTEIKDQIISSYKGDRDQNTFSNQCQAKWNKNRSNLKSLYINDQLIIYENTAGIDYYLFYKDNKTVDNPHKLLLDLLIVSEVDNIDFSVKKTIKHVKKTLKGINIEILKNSDVLLYPYSTPQNDIYDPTSFIIKASFKHKINILNLIKYIIILLISFVLIVIHFTQKLDYFIDGVILAIAGYGVATFIIDNILIYFSNRYSLCISDLSNFVKPTPQPFVDDNDKTTLQTPTLGAKP